MGSSSYNRTLSCNAETKRFFPSHLSSRAKDFCSHGTQDGRRVIKVYSISGDVEENPRPFTQINNDKNAPCAKEVNSVSLLESRLSELGRIPVMKTVFSVQTRASL